MTKVEDRVDILVEMKKMPKPNFNVTDLIEGLKTLIFDENELVSKSPMRTHEYHHYSKPYGSTSRSVGGITRVVEAEENIQNDPQETLQYFTPIPVSDRVEFQDVDIGDVRHWLNICSRNPQYINDFIANCNKEMSQKDVPCNGTFTALQQYKSDGMSICSNSSSQISSPAQSPSEHNATSPESLSCEETSLYPIIPSMECINIKPVTEDIDKLLGVTGEEDVLSYQDTYSHSNTPGKVISTRTNSNYNLSESSSPNIGTLMLNLAADNYENTIELTQFTRTPNIPCINQSDSNSTYSTTEKESLNEKLDAKAKRSAWTRISQLNVDSLGKGDKEGDTQLMILLVSEKVTLEYIYVIVERLLKENPSYIALRNELNQDALYLAAMILKREPIVASYIAEALIRGKNDVNKKYDEGNTLLHCLALQGDSHAKVLERLVRLRNQDNAPAFDINKKNNRGHTPLHVACKAHKPASIRTHQTVRILVENGADCAEKEYIDENTPLHTLINESCDPELLRTLLDNSRKFRVKDSPQLTRIPNRQGNTALHLACKRNSLDIPVQKEVVEVLLQHGAMIQLKNMNGCVPSVLVDSSRKQEIKSSLHSFRQK